jgi:hypothetical protein
LLTEPLRALRVNTTTNGYNIRVGMTDLTSGRKTLAEHAVQQILQTAVEFDAMAARAATQDGKQALERMASRLRVYAARWAMDHRPNGRGEARDTSSRIGLV